MQTLKLYTTFIYGLLSQSNNIFIRMHMTFTLMGKILLNQKLNKKCLRGSFANAR